MIKFPSDEFLNKLSSRNIPLRMDFVSSAPTIGDLPELDVPEIAIVGRSNVGKSSLINFIAGQKQLARVSNTPGRTQLINLFSVDGGEFYFADLPGYGFAESPKEVKKHWAKELGDYFEQRHNLICVLFLVDSRRDITQEDRDLSLWFQELGLNILVVQTKTDKLNKSQIGSIRLKQAAKLQVHPGMMVSTSTLKRTGLIEICTGLAGLLASARE